MHEKVQQYIRERVLIHAGDRVSVAVSGGADSVALLRMLLELRAELGIVLSVAHFSHGLRGEQSAADEAFVADLAKHLELEFFVGCGDVREHASSFRLSIEAAGRELRYRWFAVLAAEQRLDAIATAHTLDDQAETVLLKFLRGAGSRGLAGIYPILELLCAEPETVGEVVPATPLSSAEADSFLEKNDLDASLKASSHQSPLLGNALDANLKASSTRTPRYCKVIRPLLGVSRQEVEKYLTSLDQSWREDESNLDRRFLRNRVRHELLPLLEREFNPNVRQALSDSAEIARGEEEFWQLLTERELSARLRQAPSKDFGNQAAETSSADELNLEDFVRLSLALQRRVLKSFVERQEIALDFDHVDRLRRCALGELAKTELPGGRVAERIGGVLCLREPCVTQRISYQYVLPVPGEVHVAELNLTLRAEPVSAEFAQEVEPGGLLSLDLVGTELTVRNWQPGDRFWPAHSGSAEKVKRLFAEKRIPTAERASWPVILSGEEIVWVRGFAVANSYQWREGVAVRIEVIVG